MISDPRFPRSKIWVFPTATSNLVARRFNCRSEASEGRSSQIAGPRPDSLPGRRRRRDAMRRPDGAEARVPAPWQHLPAGSRLPVGGEPAAPRWGSGPSRTPGGSVLQRSGWPRGTWPPGLGGRAPATAAPVAPPGASTAAPAGRPRWAPGADGRAQGRGALASGVPGAPASRPRRLVPAPQGCSGAGPAGSESWGHRARGGRPRGRGETLAGRRLYRAGSRAALPAAAGPRSRPGASEWRDRAASRPGASIFGVPRRTGSGRPPAEAEASLAAAGGGSLEAARLRDT